MLEAVSRNGRWKIRVDPGHRWGESSFSLLRRATRAGEVSWATEAQGVCPHPCDVRCLNDGSFLLFERWGSMGSSIRPGISLREKDGAVRWAKHAAQWFDRKTWAAMTHTTSSVWWYEGLWIDEKAAVIAVASTAADESRILVPIRLTDGNRVEAEESVVLRGMRAGTEEERVLAIESARLMQTKGAVSTARELYIRSDLTPLVKLHLALVIAPAHESAARYISAAARSKEKGELRTLAITHLRRAEGTGATAYLLEVLKTGRNETWWASIEALAGQGPGVIGPVSKILLDDKLPLNARGGAAQVLGQLGAKGRGGLPALLTASRSARDGTANSAINVLREITSGQELAALYAALAEVQTGDDDLVAMLITYAPSRDAVPFLEQKIAKLPKDDDEREWYVTALDACKKAPALEPAAKLWAEGLVKQARGSAR